MVEIRERDCERIKKQAFESYKANGRMGIRELTNVIDCGCEDCHFNDREKFDLINIISSTTRAELNDEMWAKVADLIHKFELEDDRDAVIEDLPDEDVLPVGTY